jgi:membrane protein DedA with SNARE-associated domain
MGITEFIAQYVTRFMESTGYVTVFVAMVMESMVFPVPSEAVMPFAGFLVADNRFSMPLVIIISTLGSITGSLISYAIGYYGEMAFIQKHGKYLLLDIDDLRAAEKFFNKYGDVTIFVSRFIPVIRHLISIPAGFARMKLWRFMIFTVLGAGIWNTFLAYTGLSLKNNWEAVMRASRIIDIAVIILLLLLFAYYINKHLKKRRVKA